MTSNNTGIDLHYRPKGYFWPLDLRTHVVSRTKGTIRRSEVSAAFDFGAEDALPGELIQHELDPDLRVSVGRVHPWLMGGEYLPDQSGDEVEIARITIASTTMDVQSVYARRDGGFIQYRVVDEYDNDYVTGKSACRSRLPLTLRDLTSFFIGAWPLIEVLEMNFGSGSYDDTSYDADKIRAFYGCWSEFYADFDAAVERRVERWRQPRAAAWERQWSDGGRR